MSWFDGIVEGKKRKTKKRSDHERARTPNLQRMVNPKSDALPLGHAASVEVAWNNLILEDDVLAELLVKNLQWCGGSGVGKGAGSGPLRLG